MHGLGKFLAILALLGGFTSAFIATRALQVRTEWLKSVEAKQKAYEATIEPLKKARRDLKLAQDEWRRVSHGWIPYKSNLNVQPNGTGQVLVNGLGTADGWVKQNMIIHAYAPIGAEMIYVGPFQVTLAEQARVAAKAMWPQRGLFPDNWNAAQKQAALQQLQTGVGLKPWDQEFLFGPGWRIRGNTLDVPRRLPNGQLVPASDPDHHPRYDIVHVSQLLAIKDEQYLATVDYHRAEQANLVLAQQALTLRQNELHGDDSLKGKTLPKHMIVGVVRAIEDAEDVRNSLLADVTSLRRQLKQMNDEAIRLKSENLRMIRSLPGADSASNATASLSQ